jgi:hypothetical protein
MPNLIQLTEDEWFEQFKPIPNYLDDNASFHDGEHGYMFETYGDELEFVKPKTVIGYGHIVTEIMVGPISLTAIM